MAGFYGADVEQLRTLAQQLEQGAERLDDAARLLGQQVMTATAWQGRDADGFRSEWGGAHRTRIAAAAGGLRQASQAVRRNADEQDGASRADGGVGGGSGGAIRLPRLPSLPSFPGEVAWPAVEPRIPGMERNAWSYGDWAMLPEDVFRGGPLDPRNLRKYAIDGLVELVRTGVDGGSSVLELGDLMRTLTEGRSFNHLGPLLSGVKHLEGPALLSLVGLGFTASDLGTALGADDEPAAMQAALDLTAGAAGLAVPGVGLAWDAGCFIGEQLYDGGMVVWDSETAATNAALRSMYGPGVTVDDLTPEQSTALVERYEGLSGLLNSVGDWWSGALEAPSRDLMTWVGIGR